MSSASQEADCALKELVALYDDGNLRSMIEGVVGKVLVSPGSVVRPGEPMIKIVGKHRFVVAWFPLSRLYRLQVGDAVTVSTGGASLPDKIAKVSVIADAPPKEIPEGIRAQRRNTMARNEATRPYGRILAGGGGLGANHWIAAGGV
jgi:multidrug resistance efflux pump